MTDKQIFEIASRTTDDYVKDAIKDWHRPTIDECIEKVLRSIRDCHRNEDGTLVNGRHLINKGQSDAINGTLKRLRYDIINVVTTQFRKSTSAFTKRELNCIRTYTALRKLLGEMKIDDYEIEMQKYRLKVVLPLDNGRSVCCYIKYSSSVEDINAVFDGYVNVNKVLALLGSNIKINRIK